MNRKFVFIASTLAVGGLLPLTANAAAPNPRLTPASATGWGVDDQNTSTLIPNTVNGNGENTPTYFNGACPWITTAMNAFVAASPTYSYQWVPTFANLQADLKVVDYSAWVVTSPNSANGFPLTGGVTGKDAGGADFGLTYTAQNGDPNNVFFIQAYSEQLNEAPAVVALDNGGKATPWYGGASSQTAAVSKMGDEPYDSEPEAQEGYHTDVQFQTAIAVDTGQLDQNGKDILNLYSAAEWWGYQYSNTDVRPVPEPSTYIASALMLLPFGTSAMRRVRALRKAA